MRPTRQAYECDPGRWRQGVRSVAGNRRHARPLRPQHLRPVLLVARGWSSAASPYITINYEGWDTHRQNFQVMRQKAAADGQRHGHPVPRISPERGTALPSTIVWWGGEFGRNPKVHVGKRPGMAARNHWGDVFCALLAGGGFKGGHVGGRQSDAKGNRLRDRPFIRAIHRSVYELLGIDPDGKLTQFPGPRTSV